MRRAVTICLGSLVMTAGLAATAAPAATAATPPRMSFQITTASGGVSVSGTPGRTTIRIQGSAGATSTDPFRGLFTAR